jgi:hypothetical protein
MDDIWVATSSKTLETKINEISDDLNISPEDVRRILAHDPKLAINYLECLILKQSVGHTYQAIQAIEYFEKKAEKLEETNNQPINTTPSISFSSQQHWYLSDGFRTVLIMLFSLCLGGFLTYGLISSDSKPNSTAATSSPTAHNPILPTNLP